MNDLLKTRNNIKSLANAKVKVDELYDYVLENLQHSTLKFRWMSFDALDIKVYCSRDKTEIKGVIPLE